MNDEIRKAIKTLFPWAKEWRKKGSIMGIRFGDEIQYFFLGDILPEQDVWTPLDPPAKRPMNPRECVEKVQEPGVVVRGASDAKDTWWVNHCQSYETKWGEWLWAYMTDNGESLEWHRFEVEE